MRVTVAGWRGTAVCGALLIVLSSGCGGALGGSTATDAAGEIAQADDHDAVEVAERYFAALAELDYDTMAAISRGLANTAARYGQQVIAADADVFEPRDLAVVAPLAVEEGDADDGAVLLRGSMDLTTKGLGTTPLRISQIALVQDAGEWLVDDYARDGRPLSEVFRDVAIDVQTDDVTVQGDVVLTDVIDNVLLVPLRITSGDRPVTIDAPSTRLGPAGRPAELEGADEIAAGQERPVALVFRDVADPGRVEVVELVLSVDGRAITVDLPIGS